MAAIDSIKAELAKPYGAEAHQATGVTVTIGAYGATHKTIVTLDMGESLELLAQLAQAMATYREATNAHLSASMDAAIKATGAALKSEA